MRTYVTSQMAITTITLATYKRVFLTYEPSFRSLICLCRDFVRYKALDSKIGTAWMAISALFLISFPTITSAMTSYTPNTAPYVIGYDQNMFDFKSLQIVDYVIHDAHRIN